MLKIVDYNQSLIDKVSALGFEGVCGDYLLEAYNTPCPVLVTASNPHWTFGGGIDAEFLKQLPGLCNYKRQKGGSNERISNICFTITVNRELKSDPETIRQALKFAQSTLLEGETLVVCGLGTGIGGLSEDEFIDVLKSII